MSFSSFALKCLVDERDSGIKYIKQIIIDKNDQLRKLNISLIVFPRLELAPQIECTPRIEHIPESSGKLIERARSNPGNIFH